MHIKQLILKQLDTMDVSDFNVRQRAIYRELSTALLSDNTNFPYIYAKALAEGLPLSNITLPEPPEPEPQIILRLPLSIGALIFLTGYFSGALTWLLAF